MRYKVTQLETWFRTGYVYADSPEQAARITEDALAQASDPVFWDEAEYLSDIENSVEVWENSEDEWVLIFPKG